MAPKKTLCIGCITAPHGIKGAVKIRTFTEAPRDALSYGPLLNEAGEPLFEVTLLHTVKESLVARIEGINTRSDAEGLKGTYLYVNRENLPPLEEEETFYHADLIGLTAKTPDNTPLGTLVDVHDFGAGPLLELKEKGKKTTRFLPFTKRVVLDIQPKSHVILDPQALKAFD